MRRFLAKMLRMLLIAVPSFAAGGIVMAYLAASASLLSFQMLRTVYGGEEEVAAMCAQQRGDAREAARHYANAVSTYAEGGWWQANPRNTTWPLLFPFGAIVLRHAWPTEVMERRLPAVEAMYRVRLANALIAEGRPDLAANEFATAAELWGPGGQRKVDRFREVLPQVDARVPVPQELCRTSFSDSTAPPPLPSQ